MTRTKAVRRLFTTRRRGWLTATSSFILSSSWPRCTSWWPSLTGSVTSQQCWRPLSPTAAGLPSGWRCRPAGPVWCSTSGSCWALCAAVRTNPDLAARASNAAQHRPAMSPSVSDTQEVAWQEGSRHLSEWTRGQVSEGLPVWPSRRKFSGVEVTGVRGQRLTVLWEKPTGGAPADMWRTGHRPDVTGLTP